MPEVHSPAAPGQNNRMTDAEREYRRAEAQELVEAFEAELQAFLLHARDPVIEGPDAAEVVEHLPHDSNPRQDGIVALETLLRLRDALDADTKEYGEVVDEPEEEELPMPSATSEDPLERPSRSGTVGPALTDEEIRAIAHEDEPDEDALDGRSFDEYISAMANFDTDVSPEDVAASIHGQRDLPEYRDAPHLPPATYFRREVRRLCRDVCNDCVDRAKQLADAGVTDEQLLGQLAAFVNQKARHLKPPSTDEQR